MSSNQCPRCLAHAAVRGILLPFELAAARSRPSQVRRVAALRRSNGTKAASFLAPGRCRHPRIVADR
jgi:hypothetical protein